MLATGPITVWRLPDETNVGASASAGDANARPRGNRFVRTCAMPSGSGPWPGYRNARWHVARVTHGRPHPPWSLPAGGSQRGAPLPPSPAPAPAAGSGAPQPPPAPPLSSPLLRPLAPPHAVCTSQQVCQSEHRVALQSWLVADRSSADCSARTVCSPTPAERSISAVSASDGGPGAGEAASCITPLGAPGIERPGPAAAAPNGSSTDDVGEEYLLGTEP